MISTRDVSPDVKATRVIMDTDPGIDDAAAIFMALASPEIQVEALTTVFGNTPVANCMLNALRILEAAHRTDIPVYQGVPSMGEPGKSEARLHARTAPWNASLSHGACPRSQNCK